ncbi:MAG: aminoglycoside phosphotransferase family protein [Pseudomonadota bacterium]
MIELPVASRTAILSQFGREGARWIRAFPALLADCQRRWGLEWLGTAPLGLPINIVLFAVDGAGQPLVLKLGYPHPEQLTEMFTLLHYQGRLAPRVIDTQQSWRAVLMERILPGHTFRSTPPGTTLPLALFAELPQPAVRNPELPSYSEWMSTAFDKFRRQPDRNPQLAPHLDRAEALFAELVATGGVNCLLHGDLHHDNILWDGQRGWRAIDPKGVLGPRVLEAGRFIHNFVEHGGSEGESSPVSASIEDVMQARVEQLAAVMVEPAKALAGAAYVDAVLSRVWTCNDGEQPDMAAVEAAWRLNV